MLLHLIHDRYIVGRMRQLLKPKQVLDALQISRATMYRWIKEGKLKTLKIGKQIRFDPEEIERFLDRPEVKRNEVPKT